MRSNGRTLSGVSHMSECRPQPWAPAGWSAGEPPSDITFTLEPRPRAYTPGAMVARLWSGLMCLETQGPRGGRQTLVLGGVAESLTGGQVESTYVSEDPRSKPRLRLVAARHARDQPLGRNVATGHPATDGPG
jgi:hypothetical protein